MADTQLNPSQIKRTKLMLAHPVLARLAKATTGSEFEGQLWLVGGAVRDCLLGRHSNDFDIVFEVSCSSLIEHLSAARLFDVAPVAYAQFGTAMGRINGVTVEFLQARSENYRLSSRKPVVQPATLAEDALRRDFRVNALYLNLHNGELRDVLGEGLADLAASKLVTPLDPQQTFSDDPLRSLRAIRFAVKLGFEIAPDARAAIANQASRVSVVSRERVRDELVGLMREPNAADGWDLMRELGLLSYISPHLQALVGVDQGPYHHLDVWQHSLLTLRNAGASDPVVAWAALLHDIGKPETRTVGPNGRIRFFGHESVGASIAERFLVDLAMGSRFAADVRLLIRHHMRLGGFETITRAACRRLVRDLGEHLDQFLQLVRADRAAHHPDAPKLDLDGIEQALKEVSMKQPHGEFKSPLDGHDLQIEFGLQGPMIRKAKEFLVEQVIEGAIEPGDKEKSRNLLGDWLRSQK